MRLVPVVMIVVGLTGCVSSARFERSVAFTRRTGWLEGRLFTLQNDCRYMAHGNQMGPGPNRGGPNGPAPTGMWPSHDLRPDEGPAGPTSNRR